MATYDPSAVQNIDDILDAMVLRRLGGEDRDWWEALYRVGGGWRRVSVALPKNRISSIDVWRAARARANAEFLRWLDQLPDADAEPDQVA